MDRMYDEICRKFGDSPAVEIHRLPSDEAAVSFADDYFDLIYIDGNHSYEYVKADIASYLPKVKPGSFITGDDYLFDRCPNGGPKRAVDEAAATGNVKIGKISVRDPMFGDSDVKGFGFNFELEKGFLQHNIKDVSNSR